MAVLCRTHRLFEALQLAFGAMEVPAEFVNLAGLIHLPEIVEVLAYARATEDPRDGVALARILTGPRYRVGLRDLGVLAAWSRTSGGELRKLLADLALDEDDDLLEDHPFLMAEALERLDEIEGLTDEGRVRLAEFRDELDALRVAARRPVGEFLAEMIRRTGLLAELDSAADQPMALARRRNLAAFLEQVHAFQPVDGELTLRAFLEHLDSIDDDREWNPVQPSDDDSVKVMTVHAAKGLEFEAVFVPGLAHGLFPDARVQQNPARKGSSLDVELRRDRDLLPSFDDNMKAFTDALREQEVAEERRTCYVALTRAKQHLFVSSANWYGENLMAKGIGRFLVELLKWARQGGGDGLARRRARRGGRRGRPDQPARGVPAAVRQAVAGAGASRRPRRAVPGGLAPDRARGARTRRRRGLLARGPVRGRARRVRRGVGRAPYAGHASASAGGRGGRTTGSTLHRVGRRADRLRAVPEALLLVRRPPAPEVRRPERPDRHRDPPLDRDEVARAGDAAGGRGRTRRDRRGARRYPRAGRRILRKAFVQSRFGEMVPLFAERPFLLPLEGIAIKGRIDAIYGLPDGPWEVVDWKTGQVPPDDDPLARVQLDLYALACIEVWRKTPEDLKLTYFYLRTGEERSYAVDDVEGVRHRIGLWLRGIGSAAFEPTPGPQCRFCDFRPFCDAGKEWVAVQPVGQDEASRSICSSNDRYDAAGSQPPTICEATKRTCRPSGSARASRAARNQAGDPGSSSTSPLVPGGRSDGSSTTTGVGRRSVSRPSTDGSSTSRFGRPFDHVATATTDPGSSGRDSSARNAQPEAGRSSRRSSAEACLSRPTVTFGSDRSSAEKSLRESASAVMLVSATTVAVRGPPSISEISPKKSPGISRDSTRPFASLTLASPSMIT